MSLSIYAGHFQLLMVSSLWTQWDSLGSLDSLRYHIIQQERQFIKLRGNTTTDLERNRLAARIRSFPNPL